MGLGFEIDVQQSIKDAGLWKYVTYSNPVHNEWQWKRHRGHGVDVILTINCQNYNLECSYQSHYYRYTAKWFIRDRLPRFADTTGTNIIVAEIPEVYNTVSYLTNSYSITIMSVANTVSYLLSLIGQQHSNNGSVYAHDNKIDLDSNIVSSNPIIALLQEARRIKLREESLIENGINPN